MITNDIYHSYDKLLCAYEELLDIARTYREIIESNLDTSGLDVDTYPDIPKEV